MRVLRGDHCQCPACNLYFNSTYAFDKHRSGPHGVSRRCLTPSEMEALGMGLNAGDWWVSAMRPEGHSGVAADSRTGDPPSDDELRSEGAEDPESAAA